jgi:mono/diheme cytochrome c family protein
MMSRKYLLPCALAVGAIFAPLLAASSAQSHAAPTSAAQPPQKQPAAANGSQQHQDEGERIFDQNCSRCHTAPEGFSPRISGTIVRHMRVRASLSKHDEQELLRFLNP